MSTTDDPPSPAAPLDFAKAAAKRGRKPRAKPAAEPLGEPCGTLTMGGKTVQVYNGTLTVGEKTKPVKGLHLHVLPSAGNANAPKPPFAAPTPPQAEALSASLAVLWQGINGLISAVGLTCASLTFGAIAGELASLAVKHLPTEPTPPANPPAPKERA